MAKRIKEPSLEDEKLLNEIIENNPDKLKALGKEWNIGYLKAGTKRKITNILMNEKQEDKVTSKCTAALLLNGYFKLFFFYWFLWRWIYYIKQYGDDELLPIIEYCKKKVDVENYCIATIYLTEMRDTIMTMTREEVRHFLQERRGVQHGASEKSIQASQNP